MSKEDIETFIQSRPELKEDRKLLLRYLARVSDNINIIAQPRGRSRVECEFDCGAYKGSEILRFAVSSLCAITVANALIKLTSGHHFGFPEAKKAILGEMEKAL